MKLSWNEIRQRAIAFSNDWKDATRERSESQTFWNEFFHVFGRTRRAVAAYENPVKNLKGAYSFIDLIWPGVMIAEHKSRGKSLDAADSQAFEYVRALIDEGREDEAPRYIVVSDFERIALTDTEADRRIEFRVADLHKHLREFAFIAGYKQAVTDPEDDVNIEAAEKLARLKDALEDGGYPASDLERFMVRILFCLFAEDTGLLGEPDAFRLYIENSTRADGSDLGLHLAQWFEVLDQPAEKRSRHLDEQLAGLQYVNGDLFKDRLPFASFNSAMRARLLECCQFDWSKISPAVFGSLFQAIMTPKERRQIGAHYTSERDILKLLRSLFLDDLRERFEKARSSKNKKALQALHESLGKIKILDPACGCGNFLVIAYRELRLLELDILKALHPRIEGTLGAEQRVFDVRQEMYIDVDQMHGVEIEEWPAAIAKVAMWLVDHQMNVELSLTFGEPVARLPLTHSAKIVCANALRIDWNDVLPADECSYVLGNPPFIGKKEQDKSQKADMAIVWRGIKGAGVLDYVTAWYKKAAEYIGGRPIRAAFVSTNSITQGEQVGLLWDTLHRENGLSIDFAYRTFPWESEARGKAHVHVVIIGFSRGSASKHIHEYVGRDLPPLAKSVSTISPYLTEGEMLAVKNRTMPINAPATMHYGSFALDDGRYTITEDERAAIIADSPNAAAYIKPFVGAQELLHAEHRFCIWLQDLAPGQLRAMPAIECRVKHVKSWRASRERARTVELSQTPHLFAEVRQPTADYLAVPTVSSEHRYYIPIAFLSESVIASNQIYVVPNATLYHFGILHSTMHMAWVKQVCGRLESRYRYSARLVYNNFPWPESVDAKQRAAVEEAAQGVLDARAKFPDATLADLYDPLAMPKPLRDAHAKLDRAVDRCYRAQPFPDERRRFEFLFAMWERLNNPLTAATTKTKKTRRKKAR